MSLSQKDKELIDKHAKKIVDKGLGTMAIMAIESVKPLNYIGSQLLLIVNPILTIFPHFKDFDKIAELIEDRENIEYFLTRIEYFMNKENEIKQKKLEEKKKLLDKNNGGAKND